MSDFTLVVPDEVLSVARQLAKDTDKPVESILLDYLKTLPQSTSKLPPHIQSQLDVLTHMPDNALRLIIREQMASQLQKRSETLGRKNSLGTITPEEHRELEALVAHSEQLMLRKAQAMALLVERNNTLSDEGLMPLG